MAAFSANDTRRLVGGGAGESDDSEGPPFPNFSSVLGPQSCAVCSSTSNLLRCASCRVVSYCGVAHQRANRPEHKTVCNAIKKTREKLEQEEAALRAKPTSIFLPADVFNTCVGKFWGILDTRDYMRARYAAADALLEANTRAAVEAALDHFMDMLRLCRSDNMGVRDVVPPLMLRLGQEQRCYDFLKWWATADPDGKYDWGDMSLPYLNIRGANAFEPIDPFLTKYSLSLSQLVTLTLLKLRMYLDLEAYDNLEPDFGFGPPDKVERAVGELVKAKVRSIGSDAQEISRLTQSLKKQYQALCKAVHDANPHFWEALVDGESHSPPPYYSEGSPEEADLVVYQCKASWEESDDAMVMIEADTAQLASVYVGESAIATSPANATPGNAVGLHGSPVHTAQVLEKVRGAGRVIPSVFKPSPSTASPRELFAPTSTSGSSLNPWFISRVDQTKVLVFADGACLNNGQPEPRAGWAVVWGPTDGGVQPSIVADRLESKGPFGDGCVQTSNRAELRAVIAALRMRNWKNDGFSSIVVATDSAYVLDGATHWVRGWIRNGWKKRDGGVVKNRDLWELLLGEVERWSDRGLLVQLWRIPREWNTAADTAAKAAANKPAASEFRDLVLDMPAQATAGGQTRVLEICLEYEKMYDDIHRRLTSRLKAKATSVERATTVEAALAKLDQQPAPTVILVADGGITRNKKVYERVVDRLRGGNTVVLAGLFSSFVNAGEFERFFRRLGLPWGRGSYHRATVRLRPGASGVPGAHRLPASYSQKALFVSNIDRSAAWYTEEADSKEAAVAWTRVGSGNLGYVGDVNGEDGSYDVVMAMCGLL